MFEMHADNRVAGRQLSDHGRPGRLEEAGEGALGVLSGVGTLPLVLQGRRESKVVSPGREESDSGHLFRGKDLQKLSLSDITSETRFGVSGFPSPSHGRRF